jgi:hypothetical protein
VNVKHEIQQNWMNLQPGERVIVVLPSGLQFQATVECKTANSSFVWVIPDGDSRRVYSDREGVVMMTAWRTDNSLTQTTDQRG